MDSKGRDYLDHLAGKSGGANALPDNSPPKLEVLRGSEMNFEVIQWLWKDWLAGGKFHILAGPSTAGKTTLSMMFAAIVTTGGEWPDGTRCETPGKVFIWNGEDGAKDTLLPRLAAAGADLSKICFPGKIIYPDEEYPFDPAKDTPSLIQAMKDEGDVRLLIIDPIVAAVKGDTNDNGNVRRQLLVLLDFCEERKIACIGITHFAKWSTGKSALDRVIGSRAFGAAGRIVMLAFKDQNSTEELRTLTRAKANIAENEDGGFIYKIESKNVYHKDLEIKSSYTKWIGAIEGTGEELLRNAEIPSWNENGGGRLQEAKDLLDDLLQDRPRWEKEVKEIAANAGISFATLRRAKALLKIRSFSVPGGGRDVYWGTEAQEQASRAPGKREGGDVP